MSVGIMDADLSAYTLVPFNLEAMKISAYYKKKGEVVVLSPTFTPERHTKFFYTKDYKDGNYPLMLYKTPNVQYCGYAFSGDKYSPLPMEIEKMQPDTSLYAKMEQIIKGPTQSAARKKIYQNMIDCEHCRLSLDGKTIWEDYPRQFKFLKTARNLMFHDLDLQSIDHGFEEVQKIVARARNDGWATKIGMKFPVIVNKGQDLLNWSSLNGNSTFYSLRYDGVIDDDAFVEWVGKCRARAVYSQMEYHVTAPWYDENYFITTLLPKILRQIIISRSYYVFFSLTYDEGFFTDKRWEDVLRLFNYYHNSFAAEHRSTYLLKINDDTLFDFAKHSQIVPKSYYGDVLNKNQIRELFAFVRETNYPLFKDFYECSARKIGGHL